MTLKHKLMLATLVTSAVTLATVLLVQTPNLQAQGKGGRGLNVSGALHGHWTGSSWLADANLMLGDKLFTAAIVDSGLGNTHDLPSGGWSGNERWDVDVYDADDGSFVGTFALEAHYQASPSSAPGLFTLHETGSIVEGTGMFANAEGHLSIQGPFRAPLGVFPPQSDREWFWMSEIQGNLSGVEAF